VECGAHQVRHASTTGKKKPELEMRAEGDAF